MRIKRTSKPQGQAYPIGLVKDFLRLDSTADDKTILALISGCVATIEAHTWMILQSSAFTAYMDKWSDVEIHMRPVTSITSVKYYDTAGTLQTMSTSDYDVSLNGTTARIHFKTTYNLRDAAFDNIEVAFVAGYASHYDIDDDVIDALQMLIKERYDQPGGDMPLAVKSILGNNARTEI